jgi:RNA polymerase sigma-70 factor (ECF subfamily)
MLHVSEQILTPDQFVVLIARHERRVRSFIASLAACHAEVVDEVLQATYLVAWQKLESFTYVDATPDEELVRWMCTVARFEVMNFMRQSRSTRLSFDAAILEKIADYELQQTDYLEARHDALKGCLQRLPQRQRDLLSLRYWRGLSVKEIAGRLGQQANATYTLLSRIRKALERCILHTLRQEGLSQ